MNDAIRTADEMVIDYMTDGKVRPETVNRLVNLGFGVARIVHEHFWVNETRRWRRSTTLTLMTPADYTDGCAQPAASAMTNMSADQVTALIEALS